MPKKEREDAGKKARECNIENYSINVIGPFFEKFIDESPFTDYDFSQKEEEKDPYYALPSDLTDKEWILEMYHKILKMRDVD